MANKYDNLASAFGSSFEPDENEFAVSVRSVDDIAETLKSKQDLILRDEKQSIIEDQEYIQQELRIGVEILNDVTETLRAGINQGSKASSFDAFANLMKERREHIKELKDTNLQILNLKNTGNSTGASEMIPGNFTQNNLVMTGTDALDMIRKIMNDNVSEVTEYEEE